MHVWDQQLAHYFIGLWPDLSILPTKFKLLQIGKTDEKWLSEGILKYEKRLMHYINFTTTTIPSPKFHKNQDTSLLKQKEGNLILDHLNSQDYVILLDEKGRHSSSTEFAEFMKVRMLQSAQEIVFVIGGPFGFDERVYLRANELMSFSQMTFSHQMIRLFFIEQLYRSMTIVKGEPYHHI